MKLNNAYLCLDCDALHDGSGSCPECGSSQTVPISHWLRPLDSRDVRPYVFPVFDDRIKVSPETTYREAMRTRGALPGGKWH